MTTTAYAIYPNRERAGAAAKQLRDVGVHRAHVTVYDPRDGDPERARQRVPARQSFTFRRVLLGSLVSAGLGVLVSGALIAFGVLSLPPVAAVLGGLALGGLYGTLASILVVGESAHRMLEGPLDRAPEGHTLLLIDKPASRAVEQDELFDVLRDAGAHEVGRVERSGDAHPL